MDSALDRFLYVIAFAVGGLHVTIDSRKPFNPILGETYQAEYPSGTEVYMEQTSHHPPISHWEMIGEGYTHYGRAGYSASLRGNALKA